MTSRETTKILLKVIVTIYGKTPVDARSALIGMFCGPLIYNGGNFLLKSNAGCGLVILKLQFVSTYLVLEWYYM